jgi:hypothetical protein
MYGDNPIFLHLDLSNFKTEPCSITTPHEIKRCFFSHFPSEARRSLNDVFYSKILCPKKGTCPDPHCKYAHNFIEQIYHVDNYKRKYCKDFIEAGRCKYAEFCALAHSDYELKITPLHLLPITKDFLLFYFKTEFCPFSKIHHERFTCVYAHNWQDYKRPFFKELKPVPCKKWDKDKEVLEYKDGCPYGFSCDCCHGWKEAEYHIQNFKKFVCKKGSQCERKEVCSFRHDELDSTDEKLETGVFFPVTANPVLPNKSTFEYMQYIEIEMPKQLLASTNSLHSKKVMEVNGSDAGKLSTDFDRLMFSNSSNNFPLKRYYQDQGSRFGQSINSDNQIEKTKHSSDQRLTAKPHAPIVRRSDQLKRAPLIVNSEKQFVYPRKAHRPSNLINEKQLQRDDPDQESSSEGEDLSNVLKYNLDPTDQTWDDGTEKINESKESDEV